MKFPILRALMVGNVLEVYDFLLYSLFVSILSPLFFPSSDPLTALMTGFSVFAVGYAARPLGAIVFGHLGDKYGRKKSLMGTLMLMAFSTLGIGLLPTYEVIGIFAPSLLVVFRFLQGLSAGGETSGAAIFGLEQTDQARQGFIGGLIRFSTSIGTVLATLMGLLFINDTMPEWAWRIPFCLGGLIGFSGIYLRRILKDTVIRKPVKMPLLDVIQNYPFSFIKTVGIGGFSHVAFYVIAGYMNPTLHTKGLISSFELMMMNMTITLVYALLLPISGHYSDKIGLRRLMKWGALGQVVLALPLFMVYRDGSFLGVLFAQMGFLMVSAAFIAPSSAYLNTLFPVECRYSGVAIGTCLGTALFGGTTPLISSQLATLLGPLGPGLYVMGTALMGIIAVGQLTRRKSVLVPS
ncbi:MAG TPA: MFS transporter [Alphaproteobacteria bacterium]|nr:MFS transporter [Alphaproteobacteria bacterium]